MSWTLAVSGAPREVKGNGANLNAQAMGLIKNAKKGGTVSFMVKVKGPDGITRKKSAVYKVG